MNLLQDDRASIRFLNRYNSMQKKLNIKTTDKKTIFGTLDIPKVKSKWLIIFIHGLLWHQNEHIFFNGAEYFTKKWYSTYRFDLYGFCEPARVLENTCLKTHIDDIKNTIQYFKSQWTKTIFLVGHSLGGIASIESESKDITWMILWDPAFKIQKSIGTCVKYSNKNYVLDRWTKYILSKEMYHDLTVPKEQAKIIKKITTPIKIICAEYSKNIRKQSEIQYKIANEPKEFTIIPWASHYFNEAGTEKMLFKETYARIKKYT